MSEIVFKADKKHRDKYFSAGSFVHPAKMMLPLQRWLIENYTKPGDVILDPMAGCGTVLIACTMGRHVVTVELEAKFIQMQEDNWAKIQTLGPEMGYSMGMAAILQGDARNLPDILADVVISSPPYAEAQTGGGIAKHGYINQFSHSKNPDTVGNRSYMPEQAGQSEGQISNLPYGKLADVIMTSPPYEEAMGKKHHSPRADKLANEKSNPVTYTDRVDCVITSPPYENQIHKGSGEKMDWTKAHKTHWEKNGFSYKGGMFNIGNLKGQSYLSAMFQVYEQCFTVLKPLGLMCLVTKNFIRNKTEIRLDLDTIKLCEQVGFELIERHYRRLTAQSFWRTIYQQKYPDAPVLNKEDILVFRK